MDYKFTFEDGSEAIAHFGIKGMKWGVWNAETRARRTGEHRFHLTQEQKDIAKTVLKGAAVVAAITVGKIALNSILSSGSSSPAPSPSTNSSGESYVLSTPNGSQFSIPSSMWDGHSTEYQQHLLNSLSNLGQTTSSPNGGHVPTSWILNGMPSEVHQSHPSHSPTAVHQGAGITEQLLNADIPESLLAKK